MNVEDFLNLPEETREYLTAVHRKRNDIKRTRETIEDERRKLDVRDLNNQTRCDHPLKHTRYVANENEFGNLTGGGTNHYYCPDCGFRWSD